MLDEAVVLQLLAESGQSAFRLKQIRRWAYQQGELEFDHMTDLPADLAGQLSRSVRILSMEIIRRQDSRDGQTSKLAMKFVDDAVIEMVILRHQTGRVSVCISTQVGCAAGCRFCATGQMGLVRDLTAEEIADQVLLARNVLLREDGDPSLHPQPSNVIFMGMGEPFLNYDQTMRAVDLMQQHLHLGGRRVTISTVGIVPGIDRFARENRQVNLAVSLHAADNKVRTSLVPINAKYPLDELRTAIRGYMKRTNKKVFFEYILLRDINDQPGHAQELVRWLPKRLSHVNLLRFNQIEGSSYQSSTEARVKAFQKILQQAAIPVTIRHPMGEDIRAACGQLAGDRI